MKDIRLEMRIKNNHLYNLIYKNFESVNEFCRETGVGDPARIGAYINLRISPFKKRNGQITRKYQKLAIDICNYFKTIPEIIFPAEIYEIEKTFHSEEVSLQCLPERKMEMLSYDPKMEDEIDNKELGKKLRFLIEGLQNQREKDILMRRYGLDCEEETLESIANSYGVSKQYVRHLEIKAISKLRDPKRLKQIEEYMQYA